MRRLLLAAAILLALTGCNGDDDADGNSEGETVYANTNGDPGDEILVKVIMDNAEYYPDFSALEPSDIASTGRLVCDGFLAGLTYSQVHAATMVNTTDDPWEAQNFMVSAVVAMCDEYSAAVGE